MNYWFLAACFFVGVSASSTMGPIFIMTFNNSAVKGFLKGFFTALGAALGDGLLIFLGLVGTLAVLQKSATYQVLIDLVGGSLLLLYGLKLLFYQNPGQQNSHATNSANSLILSATKSFLSTVINPLTILFFMFAGAQVLPNGKQALSTTDLVLGSLVTILGSLMILTVVAYIASSIGKVMKPEKLKLVGTVTACIMLTVGSYFFFDALKVIVQVIRG
jgi:threonine/homoserine/homoserine lactone efflux protein